MSESLRKEFEGVLAEWAEHEGVKRVKTERVVAGLQSRVRKEDHRFLQLFGPRDAKWLLENCLEVKVEVELKDVGEESAKVGDEVGSDVKEPAAGEPGEKPGPEKKGSRK